MILTDAATDLLIACFVVFVLAIAAFVVAEMFMRLLAVILALFGVDTGDG